MTWNEIKNHHTHLSRNYLAQDQHIKQQKTFALQRGDGLQESTALGVKLFPSDEWLSNRFPLSQFSDGGEYKTSPMCPVRLGFCKRESQEKNHFNSHQTIRELSCSAVGARSRPGIERSHHDENV